MCSTNEPKSRRGTSAIVKSRSRTIRAWGMVLLFLCRGCGRALLTAEAGGRDALDDLLLEDEEDDDEDSGDVDIENKYYNAKQLKLSNPEEAVEEFLGIPALEEEKGEWGFKGLKQAIKLEFKLGKYDEV